ncbi:alcohol dehydrogenase [Rhodoferax lacus]|uniref:Alcohol dehydrogenase n=1 Tax=Rhodoferax lacus TaxID=2184758 RepID=A0A3E1RCK5_9BURK|nr:iron-containing alcohol dehydrogenase [Rhodoferax lacus]RFO97097.1 alcohol dehydrogenase [Rhodoferax lacus]
MAAPALHLAWANPVRIHWGAGCFQSIAADQPVVVLADRAALGYEDETLLGERLGAQCKAWSWYQGGLGSVPLAQMLCDELWPVLQAHPQAAVLALGGGTTLDLAKVLRYRMADSRMAAAHWRNNTLPEHVERHPLWLVPTTAGTGSEVTRWATLWDTDIAAPAKLSWAPADGFAEQAFVDPCLSLSCPQRLTRDCALDTLAHALESLWNRNANPITEALALDAARLVLHNLPSVLEQPGNIALRAELSRASLLAGLAMSQTQTALAHALSYALTLKEGLPHGEACAVWLPMVWELAVQQSPSCDAALARVFGGTVQEGTKQAPQEAAHVGAQHGAQALRLWLQTLGVAPRDLRQSASGRAQLDTEMRSARGRNFIVNR